MVDFSLRSYPCRSHRVVDGDTLDLEIDLGFHTSTVVRVRLARVNCPETRGEHYSDAGEAARDFTCQWVMDHSSPGWAFVVRTRKADKWGRWIGELECVRDGSNLSDALLASGHASSWAEGPRK